jgi:hypothetical protein
MFWKNADLILVIVKDENINIVNFTILIHIIIIECSQNYWSKNLL